MLTDIWHDFRHAGRLLATNLGFSAAAILTLALGIGLSTAIYTVVNAVLLRPAPFPAFDRLVLVWETDRDSGTSREPGSYPDWIDFRDRSRRVERLAAFAADESVLTPASGEPSRVASLVVSGDVPAILGIEPLAGRTFTSGEDRVGGPDVVLLSERLWARLFQRDPGAIGRTISIDEKPRTIVGIVPQGSDFGLLQILSAADYGRAFADRDPRTQVDVWMPMQADATQFPRDTHPFLMVGRLAPQSTVATAQQELAAIAADLERAYSVNKARGVFVEPLRDVIFGRVRPALLVLLAAVGFVLLISCTNVANLLLARGTARVREVAVRTALGAEPRRLARQFIVESSVLTGAAAVLGVLLAVAALRVLVTAGPPGIPRLSEASIDAPVLLVALVVSIGAGLLFGMVPVVQARRTDIQAALKSDDARGATAGREGGRMRSVLVVAEVGLAVVLVTGACLLLESFWKLQQVNPGFDAAGVLKAEFQLPAVRYPVNFAVWPNLREMHQFNAALLERVARIPGIEAAAIAGNHPLDAGSTNSFVIVGRETESEQFPEISIRRVTPGYFRALRVPLVRGRALADADTTDAPAVVLINEAAAARFFPGRDPIGQQIAFWGARRTVVGVLANERFHGIAAAAPLAAYTALSQTPSANGAEALIVRTAADPEALAGSVRAAIREIDPGLAVFGVEPLEQTVSESMSGQRFIAVLLAMFAALALVLAAIGIHGVLSYAVAQRGREIGIRMALGAAPDRVLRLVLGQAARLVLGGLVVGVLLALALSRWIAGLLYGVEPTDAVAFASVLAVLTLVAAAAVWLPARRAIRVDPVVALRQE